jgi:WD40 repeat protein
MRVFDSGQKKRVFSTVALDGSGQMLAAGGDFEPTIVWDIATGTELQRFPSLVGHNSQQLHFANAALLLAPTRQGLHLLDIECGITTIGLGGEWYAGCLAVDPAGDWVVVSHASARGASKLTALVKPGTRKQKTVWSVNLSSKRGESGESNCLTCLADGKRFLTAERLVSRHAENSRYRITIRSRKDGSILEEETGWAFHTSNIFASPVQDVVIVLDGNWFRAYRLDDMSGPADLARNDAKKDFLTVAFHPSGKYLAATNRDSTVMLYDMTSWKCVRTFTWDIGRIRSVAFSADGTLAAAGSDKGKVVVWDVDI